MRTSRSGRLSGREKISFRSVPRERSHERSLDFRDRFLTSNVSSEIDRSIARRKFARSSRRPTTYVDKSPGGRNRSNRAGRCRRNVRSRCRRRRSPDCRSRSDSQPCPPRTGRRSRSVGSPARTGRSSGLEERRHPVYIRPRIKYTR